MRSGLIREVRAIFSILSKRDKHRFLLVSLAQSCLGIIDLLGVVMMGIVGALSIRGIQSQPAGDKTSLVMKYMRLNNLEFQDQIKFLAVFIIILFSVRTVLTIYLTRRILHFLGRKGAEISSSIVSRLLAGNLVGANARSSYDVQYAVGPGVSALSLGVLGVASTAVSDFSLLLIIGIGVIVLDPITAITAIVLFGTVSTILYFGMHKKAKSIGVEIARANIETNKIVSEMIFGYREIYTRNRRTFYYEKMDEVRKKYSNYFADQTFLPNISKYVVELSVVIGAVFVAAIQFMTKDAAHAAAGLGLFFAAGSRIAPALLRLQQSLVQIQGNLGGARPTLKLIESLSLVPELQKDLDLKSKDSTYSGFQSQLSIKNVNFSYPGNSSFSLRNLSLNVEAGQFIAFAGRSGSGKSTILDLILGINIPSSGEVKINNSSPLEAIRIFPGAIAYVPQVVSVVEGSIAQNVTLGYPDGFWDEEEIIEALMRARVLEEFNKFPNGIHTLIGELGNGLSGGQKQRLGIARAYLTRPKMLFLDEATSSLDATTELEISRSIQDIRGETTVIVIAHRLSTIRSADVIFYIEKGQILFKGSFEDLKVNVPEFQAQAKSLGL